MCESSRGSLRPGHCAIWKTALVGSNRSQPARQPPATPQLPGQFNQGCTADHSETHASEWLRAHTSGVDLRHQTTTVWIKVSKHLQSLQGKRALRLPYTWCTSSQSGHDRARAWQGSRDDVLARPRGEASGQNHFTGRRRRGQESCWTVGKMKGEQGGICLLDVVDGRISNRRWRSMSHSTVVQWR